MLRAVEFEAVGKELHLLYAPRDGDEWVHAKFDRGKPIVIKGTFHLTRTHLVQPLNTASEGIDIYNPLRFRVANARRDYFTFDPDVINLDCPVLLHREAHPTWKWFSSERSVSILAVLAQLKPKRIVIGGPDTDAIPIADYKTLIEQFPTPHELKRYVLARVSAVVRDYVESPIDAEALYQAYVEKRLDRRSRDLRTQFFEQDARKYKFILERLRAMLGEENTYPESVWQQEILQIILLLNPRYIKALTNVRIAGDDGAPRFIDMLLVDASGHVDVIEIKKPFDKSIVTTTVYRNNHVPLRELSGSVMQIEKYIYRLNRWGRKGETDLTKRYASELPKDFIIRITNPSGIIITGRDYNLTAAQRRDLEFVRRKYKSVVDIITYDDLLRRLTFVITQLTPPARRPRRLGKTR